MYIIFHFCLQIILNITQCTFNIVFNVNKLRGNFHIILHLWIKILQEKELSCRESTHLRLKSENSKQNVSKVKLKVIMYEVYNELVNVLSKCACYFLKHNAKKKSRRKFSSHLHLI